MSVQFLQKIYGVSTVQVYTVNQKTQQNVFDSFHKTQQIMTKFGVYCLEYNLTYSNVNVFHLT